jgi:nitrate/TMAO reductase-like tetraheme cytochrome c subunit
VRNFFIALTRNPLSLAGTAITTASAVIIISLFALELVGFRGNPYMGILAFLILPAIFIAGLTLIPWGILRERRRERRAAERGEPPPSFPVIDLNRRRTQRTFVIVLSLTLANVVILAAATYKGVEVMDSKQFCGETCHSVMAPEYTAYQRGPHARVACVDCHIGPGASWFVKSKLSGTWQVVAIAFDLYPRPVPTPIEDLRPARETCEQCHWPTLFVGDRLKVNTSYDSDEANSELKTVLLLRVGGVAGRSAHGIHWHVDPGNRIRYRSDPSRETIYDVELTLPDGTTKTFHAPADDAAEADRAAAAWRTMDCVDCHNRPAHVFHTPEQAVDQQIAQGRIDRSLPFVRREGLKAVAATYPTQEAARDGIRAAVTAFYSTSYPDVARDQAAAVTAAGEALADAYSYNVFPTMNVGWSSYPVHIGHEASPGCFRCHDEEHSTDDGETISQDCSTCHSLLAMEERNPQILTDLQP